MSGLRIGSLFSGTGALDLAVQAVYGGRVVWHSQYEPPDKHGREQEQHAAAILARHWPGVPNLGDITRIDWRAVVEERGPVDILTGGFPCTDVSSAGRRAGLAPGTRSGLWSYMAHAISVLRPRLVVIENVQGLLSTKAAGDVGACPHCVGDRPAEPPLRALGAVLGDLAGLGFDAEWARVAASEVGAPHPRKRVFVLAWPAATDAAHVGHERAGAAWGRGSGSADGGLAAAHAGGAGLEVGGVEPDRHECPAAERGRGEPAADADGGGLAGHGELPAGWDGIRRGLWADADGRRPAAADAPGQRRRARGAEPARVERGLDAAERGGPAAADADSLRRRAEILDLRPGQPDVDWGPYGPAVRRWEAVLGRPAPWPTDVRGRLSPVFSEWLMGLPDGWVTCTPGLTRNPMLHALGNGVVPLQAGAALRLLHGRGALDGAPLPPEAAA
ncbi:DNA cytosine methyltransferase [Streptomyces klenkii]|uniref:DNA (cytosine-5-)-methyltransferase n=1 Tax=Streptomyces klenkii TaxID=1420899 RepID=A0A3B0ARD8_9ACTN|nr:DNA cytosine methyltransferase [Streptomyces klenkii]RKN61896.1 DNA cytosine methyltransferase [Streptomyces klenkii]